MNTAPTRPWPILWTIVVGFFMILLDTTIVMIATPALIAELGADINQAVWVTSAYLLTYAVPLLITGRLGDRFGPGRIYMIGLVVFTLSSVWAGFSTTVESLIVARAVQGLGAALLTPQTMAIITRVFPLQQRGSAMAVWGSVAGIASLVGPLLGGLLTDTIGWEWIFFINVPIGAVGLIVAWRILPKFETHSRTFDWFGTVLSAAGIFAIVYGVQEGAHYDWGLIGGWLPAWALIAAGVALMVVFVFWQKARGDDALVPLDLFRSRNFSASTIAITAMGVFIGSYALPATLYLQSAEGLTPTTAALVMAPSAILSILGAPFIGRLVNRIGTKALALSGFVAVTAATFALAFAVMNEAPMWLFMTIFGLFGIGTNFVMAPVSTTATSSLGPARAGAGSGVYNQSRQLGAVLGSAAIAAMMTSRLAEHLGGGAEVPAGEGAAVANLPEALHAPFAQAMGESILLPAVVLVVGVVATLFFTTIRFSGPRQPAADAPAK